ncbi:MAG: helix-turn-helix domain-containing protein [Actinomycetota bacterium]
MPVELIQSAAGRMFVDLVDGLPQLMGSLKGLDGRYCYVNEGFRTRVGRELPRIIGATVDDLFTADLAATYTAQDESVLATRRPLRAHLELIVRADGTLGWYVTSKSAVREDERVLGVAAVSLDLRAQLQSAQAGLAAAIEAVRGDVGRPWRFPELAAIAGLSQVQLERQCRRTLGISPRGLIQRQRIEHAVQLITGTDATIGEIASTCGFYDQSSFTRQFRRLLGLTPGAYRSRRN